MNYWSIQEAAQVQSNVQEGRLPNESSALAYIPIAAANMPNVYIATQITQFYLSNNYMTT